MVELRLHIVCTPAREDKVGRHTVAVGVIFLRPTKLLLPKSHNNNRIMLRTLDKRSKGVHAIESRRQILEILVPRMRN